jgi:hypothetical protein
MKNATSSLGSARPSDYELSSSSSSHLFSDSNIENITKEEKEEEEEQESIADDSLYEEFMVPNEVIVPSKVPSVPKIPEIVKSHHGSSSVVTEVINVDEPVLKVAAVNWIVRGRVQSSEPPQSTFRLKEPPPPCPLKTMPYVSVETAKLLLSGLKALRKDNAGKGNDRPSKKLKKSKMDKRGRDSPESPEKNIGGTTINEMESIIKKVLADDEMKVNAKKTRINQKNDVLKSKLRSWKEEAIKHNWRLKHLSEMGDDEFDDNAYPFLTFTPAINAETSSLQYFIKRPREIDRNNYKLHEGIPYDMRLLQELINNNEGGRNNELIIATMETILGTIVYACRYPFDRYFEKSFIPHINSIINLLRCEDKVRAKQLLEITNYIKWNSLRLAIICDPENSDLNQDQRMSPISFQDYHRGYDRVARRHIRERCVGMRPIMNSVEFAYHPDPVFDNLRHYKRIARVNAVQTTDPPPRDDNDMPPDIRSVTNIEEGPYAPVNLEENFSAYITPSTINDDEQNVARMMPTETLYKPESNLMDYVERVMDRRLSLIMDTIQKEEKLPLKSDPNERDSSMAYLRDPPLTSLATSPIAKLRKL